MNNHVVDWLINKAIVSIAEAPKLPPYEIHHANGGLVCFSKSGSKEWLSMFIVDNYNLSRADKTKGMFLPLSSLVLKTK